MTNCFICHTMKQDVAAYYNQTQNHYLRWWQLSRGMALHYGMWYAETRSFLESLNNTNKHLAELSDVREGNKILDAGCGVGGSSIYMAKNHKALVTGITLSELQVKTARENATFHKVGDLTNFQVMDFCKTKFQDESFDIVWACESSSSAADKELMVAEWYRLLKPGGKLVLSDFFKTKENQQDKENLLDKWTEIWAMSPLISSTSLIHIMKTSGFQVTQTTNMTKYIYKTVKRMHLSYWLGLIPSVVYNTFFGARKYARNHYKSGLYQYSSLKKGLWQYHTILATKPAGSH